MANPEHPISPEFVDTYRAYIHRHGPGPRVQIGPFLGTRADILPHIQDQDAIGKAWVNILLEGLKAESDDLPVILKVFEKVQARFNPRFYEHKLIRTLREY